MEQAAPLEQARGGIVELNAVTKHSASGLPFRRVPASLSTVEMVAYAPPGPGRSRWATC